MPATQQQIDDLQSELETLAQTIADNSTDLSETVAAIAEADEEIQAMRAAKLSTVLNARFQINNKLQYTNDDQRKVAVQESLDTDADYNAMKNARVTLLTTQAEQFAEVEKNRNLHKIKLLVLQFYANLP